MLQRLEITNYRSIAQATIDLRPFTILVGANGSGKSNLLKLLVDLRERYPGSPFTPLAKHLAFGDRPISVALTTTEGARFSIEASNPQWWHNNQRPSELATVRTFTLDPRLIGGEEALVPSPDVKENGLGAIQVLDSLKTGDREDLFNTIEAKLREFVPEIEKLSFAPGGGHKSLQVREAGIPTPVPVRELSEGTRLLLTILTIVYQERKPTIIGLEGLDHGLHPALFGKIVDVCRNLVQAPGAPQIIATTHNPYLVDQFIDDEDSVILVEKKDAKTTFTSLRERLAGLDRGSDTLGGVWYSGLVGGAPVVPVRHLPKTGG